MGGVGSGGPNGGPQYNPANVSLTGGDGQSGDYKNFAYGQNKAVNEQRVAGNKAVKTVAPETGAPQLPELTQITAGTELPGQSIMDGAARGDGNGTEALGLPTPPTGDPDIDMVRSYLPAMEMWANMPTTSNSTKEYINYLRTIL
jgi:hypothetical protein